MSTVPLGVRLPDRIGVFDAETDGVDVESCHIVTAFIGLMDTATGVIVEKWEWLLNTGHEIPQGASDVHGITTERMRAEGTDPKQGVFEITQRLDIIGRAGITMVVMNAPFDFTLLDRELLRHWPEMRPLMEPDDEGKVQRPWVFDPMTFDRAISKRAGSRKLVDLARFYGVPVETNAHDAEADCRMAGRVAIKLLQHSKLEALTLSQVHEKLIPTYYNNSMNLAEFWERGGGLKGSTPQDRAEAVRNVREHAQYWPMRPRPIKEG